MNFEYTLLFFTLSNMIFTIIYYDNDFRDNDLNNPYEDKGVT